MGRDMRKCVVVKPACLEVLASILVHLEEELCCDRGDG